MKKTLFFLLLFGVTSIAQPCTLPPPPAMTYLYAVDYDNDGHTIFDIGYFIDVLLRPGQVAVFGVSPNGYNYLLFGANDQQYPATLYTNIETPTESVIIEFEYTGVGPEIAPLPPCFWPVETNTSVRLIPMPYNQDFDNDGIWNIDEDTNNNGNLMDDDDDSDGVLNIIDNQNSLGISEIGRNDLTIYPNPVSDGVLNIDSNIPFSLVTLFDTLGREIRLRKIVDNTIRLQDLAKGTYLIRFGFDGKWITRKIIVE